MDDHLLHLLDTHDIPSPPFFLTTTTLLSLPSSPRMSSSSSKPQRPIKWRQEVYRDIDVPPAHSNPIRYMDPEVYRDNRPSGGIHSNPIRFIDVYRERSSYGMRRMGQVPWLRLLQGRFGKAIIVRYTKGV